MHRALLIILLLLCSCLSEKAPEAGMPAPQPEPTMPEVEKPVQPEHVPTPKSEEARAVSLNLLWNFSTGEPVYGVDVGSRYVAVASYDNRVYLLTTNGSVVWSFKTRGNAEAVALSEEENYLLATSYLIPEARIYLFRIGDDNVSLLWERSYGNLVKGCDVSEELGMAVIATGDGTARAYSLTGAPLWSFRIQQSAWGVWDVEIACGRVALAGDDTYLYLLNSDGALIWKRSRGRRSYLYGCGLSCNLAAAASQDRGLYVYDKGGRLLWTYTTGDSNHDVAISTSQELIALSSWDGKVRIFSSKGKLMAALSFHEKPTRVAFSRDGRLLAVATRGGVYVYEITEN